MIGNEVYHLFTLGVSDFCGLMPPAYFLEQRFAFLPPAYDFHILGNGLRLHFIFGELSPFVFTHLSLEYWLLHLYFELWLLASSVMFFQIEVSITVDFRGSITGTEDQGPRIRVNGQTHSSIRSRTQFCSRSSY